MPCETMRHQELETPVLRHHVRSCRIRRCPRRWHGAPSGPVAVDSYYDPQTGRFLSVDPKVAQTQQAYMYTSDDPVNEIDRAGMAARGSTPSFVASRATTAVIKAETFSPGSATTGGV